MATASLKRRKRSRSAQGRGLRLRRVTDNYRVQVFHPDGRFYSTFGKIGGPREPERFQFPTGIAFDPAGHVYIVDRVNRRVQVFTGPGGGFSNRHRQQPDSEVRPGSTLTVFARFLG
jgi:DNA-binding beta-propeller fold protein YncE